MSSEEKFRVDLGGIVELLSRNLYSGSDVYLRELLQNGVDAITANAQSGKDDVRTVVIPVDVSVLSLMGTP